MEKKLVLAIEKLTAIEEFARDLREYLESSLDVSKDVSAPSPTKVEEKPVKEVVKAVEEPVQEDDLQSAIDEYGLNDLSLAEIKEFLDSATSPVEYNKKAKKVETLVPILAKAIIDGLIPLDDDEEAEEEVAEEDDEEVEVPTEEEDEEDLTVADIEKMTLKELLELASENELEVPVKIKKDVKAVRELIIETFFADEDTEEEVEEEETEEYSEEEDTVDISPERKEAEAKIAGEIEQKYGAKKLTIKHMKDFLKKYYNGKAECKDCKGCKDNEVIACYTQLKQNFVDDSGDVMGEGEAYERDGEVYCCGTPCDADPDDDSACICQICGEQWDLSEE